MPAAALPPRPAPSSLPALAGWTGLDLLFGAGLVFATVFLLGLALGLAQRLGFDPGPPVAALGGLPARFIPLSLIGTALAGTVLYALHRRRLPASGKGRWSAGLLLASLLLALGLQALAVALASLGEAIGLSTTGSNVPLIRLAFEEAPLLTAFAVLVLAPVGEELVFRRVLLERFARAGRGLLGLLVTACVFALVHEPLPAGRGLPAWGLTLGTYLLMGLGFGLFYLRTRRVDAAILAHALLNALGLALVLAA
ncbi:MAG: lysostaphin resistance A-like protein [Silanimonas lenta]